MEQKTTLTYDQQQAHLHVFLGIFEVSKKSIVSPDNPGLLVGGGIRITVLLSGLVSEKAIEIGTLLVGSSLLDSVALGALGLEDLGSLLFVSSLFLTHFDVRFCFSVLLIYWKN